MQMREKIEYLVSLKGIPVCQSQKKARKQILESHFSSQGKDDESEMCHVFGFFFDDFIAE